MDPPQTPLRPAIGVTATIASLQAEQHGGDLRGGVRAHDHGRALRHRTLGRPPDGQGPPVTTGFGPAGVVGDHLGTAGRQTLGQAVRKGRRGAGEVIGDGGRLGVDRE